MSSIPLPDLYDYTPLPKQALIRILELMPGKADTALEILLHIASLDNHSQYEALSYTWGYPDDCATIRCSGKLIKLPKNLQDALYSLRSSVSSVFLWADSLCINQNSTEEKNHQVAMMGKIYEQASQVIVWLGADPEAVAGVAFSLARQIAHHEYPAMPRKTDLIPPRQEVGNDLEWYALVEYAHPEQIKSLESKEISRWNALADIYRRLWFTRVWVIQEVGMASSVTVICGTAKIDWKELTDAAGCIDDRARPFATHFNMEAEVQRCFDLYWIFSRAGSEQNFVETLNDARSFLSSNPKDKVYALLSHPSARADNGKMIIEPDYESPMAELYMNLAIKLVKSTASLQILSAVQHRTTNDILGSSIPSWVPRWAERPWSFMLWGSVRDKTYRAGVDTESKYDLLYGSRTLKIRGVLFDRVFAYCDTISGEEYGPETFDHANPVEALEDLMRINEKSSRSIYATEEQWTRAQFMTLTAGMFMGGQADFDSYRRWKVLGSLNQRSDLIEGNATLFTSTAGLWSDKRKPYVTEQGYIGLGPSLLEKNDCLCVIFGCMVPFILRGDGGQYRLIGESYLHGVMKGEAIEMWRNGSLLEQDFLLY